MKVNCVFSLESPHQGDSNEYIQYSGTSTNGHLSKIATSLKQPVFSIPAVQFYNIFDLSIAATSLLQPLLCCPMGGCYREVALYTIFNIKKEITLNYPKSAAMGFYPGIQE